MRRKEEGGGQGRGGERDEKTRKDTARIRNEGGRC